MFTNTLYRHWFWEQAKWSSNLEKKKMQETTKGKFTNIILRKRGSGKTCGHIYPVSCWGDDKAENKSSTYILSCHSLEPEWSWRPRGYARCLASEWCLQSRGICSGQHKHLHSGSLCRRTREQRTCKASDSWLNLLLNVCWREGTKFKCKKEFSL